MTPEEAEEIKGHLSAVSNIVARYEKRLDPPLHKNRKIRWGDWFSGTELNTDKWRREDSTYGDGNNEEQAYHPDQVTIEDDCLTLRAIEGSHRGRSVISGMVRAKDLTLYPGEVIRVKYRVESGGTYTGLWPAIWASSWTGDRWPAGGELDVLEIFGANNPNDASFNIHWADSNGKHKHDPHHVDMGDSHPSSWTTINLHYGTNNTFTWEFNDDPEQRYSIVAPDLMPFSTPITGWKINLALGGNPGDLDRAALPARFQVQSVVVYESEINNG